MLKIFQVKSILKRSQDVVSAVCCTAINGNFISSEEGANCMMCIRHSFLGRLTEEQLWEGVTSVSNAGRKGGRQKGSVGKKISLNRKTRLGDNYAGTKYLGLNLRLHMQDGKVTNPFFIAGKTEKDKKAEEGEEEEEVNFFLKDKYESQDSKLIRPKNRSAGIPPMQRGYHGTDRRGRSLGPAEIETLYNLDDFDAKLIDMDRVSNMTKIGRVTGFRALVAVGNGNGVGGYGLANSVDSNQAIRVAKLRAFNRLYFVERYNGHTIFHDFYVQEHKTKLTVQRQSKGFGVVGSLVIKDLCYLLGIKDIYVKTEGARKNYRHVVRGFFEGLLDQETHQQLADRTNLYVVEVRDDRGNFPVVVASPSGDEVREALQGDEDEWLNVDSMYSGGKIKLKTKRKVPMYELNNYPSWQRRCQAVEKRRGQFEARWERYASGLEPSEEELKERFVPKPKNN